MTGTGTSADPLIVSTWADFKTAIGTSSAYVVMDPDAETKVIDLNDTADAEGLTNTLIFQCASIQGNGWTIRNLCFQPGNYHCFQTFCSTVQDLSLLNIVVNAGGASVFNIRSNCTFQNCNFSIQHNFGDNQQALFTQYSSRSGTFRDSAIYVRGIGTGVTNSYITSTNFYNCNLYLDTTLCGAETSANISLFVGGTIHNTSVRGKIRMNRLADAVNTTQHLFQSVNLNGSYAAIEWSNLYESETGMTIDMPTNNVGGVCFVDADLVGDGITMSVSGTGMYALTTAQCKSAEYLQSIGFACTEAALI